MQGPASGSLQNAMRPLLRTFSARATDLTEALAEPENGPGAGGAKGRREERRMEDQHDGRRREDDVHEKGLGPVRHAIADTQSVVAASCASCNANGKSHPAECNVSVC